MSLRYVLYDNQMTADPNDKMAVTVTSRQFTIEDVIAKMISRGSTVTKAEALSVFEEQNLAIEDLLKDGMGTLVTPMFNASFSIVGVFDNEEDSFDPRRHQVRIRISPGVRLKVLEKQIKTQKEQTEIRLPAPVNFYDNGTETVNDALTPSGGMRLRGSLLKIDELKEDEGVFFVNTQTAEETKVTGKFLRNKPAELIFNGPALPSGTYRLEVRNRYMRTKEVRTGALPLELTVG